MYTAPRLFVHIKSHYHHGGWWHFFCWRIMPQPSSDGNVCYSGTNQTPQQLDCCFKHTTSYNEWKRNTWQCAADKNAKTAQHCTCGRGETHATWPQQQQPALAAQGDSSLARSLLPAKSYNYRIPLTKNAAAPNTRQCSLEIENCRGEKVLRWLTYNEQLHHAAESTGLESKYINWKQ